MHHIFTRTIADVHGGRERPEPKVAGRRERQRGSTSPAEGKGNGATRRRPKGKATGQHVAGRRERQSGSREHWRFHPEIHFKRFLLPLQGADHPDTSYPGCHSLRSFCPGLGSFWAFSPYKSYKVSLLSVNYLQAGCS